MNSSNASTNDSDSCWRSVSLGMLVANLIWSIALSAGTFLGSRKLLSILDGFEAKQGWITAFSLSQGFLYVVIFIALVSGIKERIIGCPRRRLLLNFVHLYLILILQAIYAIGIFAPLAELINRLS